MHYFQRRNFTLKLVVPATPLSTTVSFPDGITGLTAQLSATGQLLTDPATVLCAVNLSGQQRYRIRPGSFNAYCWDGVTLKTEWAGYINHLRYQSCVILYFFFPFFNSLQVTGSCLPAVMTSDWSLLTLSVTGRCVVEFVPPGGNAPGGGNGHAKREAPKPIGYLDGEPYYGGFFLFLPFLPSVLPRYV